MSQEKLPHARPVGHAHWAAYTQFILRRQLASTTNRAERKAIKDALYRTADARVEALELR